MRRWIMLLVALVTSVALVLTAGCTKKTVKETTEQGEDEKQGPGPQPPK
jgi:ABC-type oligopeptide transport system substrate-binding subunit